VTSRLLLLLLVLLVLLLVLLMLLLVLLMLLLLLVVVVLLLLLRRRRRGHEPPPLVLARAVLDQGQELPPHSTTARGMPCQRWGDSPGAPLLLGAGLLGRLRAPPTGGDPPPPTKVSDYYHIWTYVL